MSTSAYIPLLEKLDLEGDTASLGQRWEKWKRSLKIYLEANGITTPIKERATLLLLGGSNLQEIFYNLPGANAESCNDNDVFAIAVQKLDDYFTPKQSKVYERHVFRLMKQEEGEKFEKFLVRLRNQAEKCRFEKAEDHLIDQIAEKYTSVDLRKKILTSGDSITLEKIVIEANTLEVVNRQLEEYGQQNKNPEINALASFREKGKASTYDVKTPRVTMNRNKVCGRCGSHKHQSEDTDCLAKRNEIMCFKCGKLGHFRQFCKSNGQRKRKIDEINKKGEERPSNQSRKRSRINNIEDEEIDCRMYLI